MFYLPLWQYVLFAIVAVCFICNAELIHDANKTNNAELIHDANKTNNAELIHDANKTNNAELIHDANKTNIFY